MRTQDEIIDQIEKIAERDVLGFGRDALIGFLDWEHVQPYLKDGVTEDEWSKAQRTDPIDAIMDYMEFAWEKAMRQKGISAARSLAKMQQWAWLSGDEVLMDCVDPDNYYDYGKAQLADVCKHLDIRGWKDWATDF